MPEPQLILHCHSIDYDEKNEYHRLTLSMDGGSFVDLLGPEVIEILGLKDLTVGTKVKITTEIV